MYVVTRNGREPKSSFEDVLGYSMGLLDVDKVARRLASENPGVEYRIHNVTLTRRYKAEAVVRMTDYAEGEPA